MSDRPRAALRALLEPVPGVEVVEKKDHSTFTIRGKVFAYTRARDDGVILKMPTSRIETLIAEGRAAPLIMGKRLMREWAVLPGTDRDLVLEALAFVST